ncbi:MAG: FHA domain-containing protein [Bacteroidales bacterium]|nr:FHA domain-containing protein [Bacteroidales bacterium]
MKNQPTAQQKNQFSKSLGSGFKSVFGSKGRTYFILEHRTHSTKHKAGDVQEIIVDYIELGRDPKCQVRFGDDMPTVSRRHCAIQSEGDKWIIKNIQTTNQTIVNGRPISNQWYLQNGDEIQLSADGPKFGFIVPQNNTVKSLGLSKRLSLFRQQALRPYKTAITVLSVFMLLAISGLAGGLYFAKEKIDQQDNEIALLLEQNLKNDSLRQAQVEKIQELEGAMGSFARRLAQRSQNSGPSYTPDAQAAASFSSLYPGVYQIIFERFSIVYEGETQNEDVNSPIGSGFLLKDGRFITARHVVEPWYFADEDEEMLLTMNMLLNLGARITANFRAVSPAGTSFTFTNHDMTVDRSEDEQEIRTDNSGNRIVLTFATLGPSDWARLNTSNTGGLDFDAELCNNLTMRTELDVLGYPLGMAATSGSNISPIYGSCVVGADGLQEGVILISARNFEHGNSGGPVFVQKDGRHFVVGIISAGTGDGIGFIVPISVIR